MTQSSPTDLGSLPSSKFWQAGSVYEEQVLPHYPCTAPLIVYAFCMESEVSSFSSLLLSLPGNPCFFCRAIFFSVYEVQDTIFISLGLYGETL